MDLTGKRLPAITTIFIRPWLLLILLSLLSRTTEAQPAPIYRLVDLSCQNTFNSTSTYQANRDAVFNSLSSNATRPIGFYNASSGTRRNETVYGIFICRGDLSISDCSACVILSTYYIAQRCPNATIAGVWYEECLVRYSNLDIASAVDFEPSISMFTDRNATDRVGFNRTLSSLMNDAVTRAVNEPPGAKKFATAEANVSSSQTLYTLAQCQPNLSGRDCNRCLQRTIRNLSDCCSGKVGALVFNPVCTIRYEIFPFYNLTAVDPRSGQNGNGPNRKTVLIATFSSIFGLALFSVCGYLIWGRVRRKIQENIEHTQEIRLLELIEGRLDKGGETPDNFSGEHEEEFPSIQLDILLAATNHFSSQNKLGQGGFGPVYLGTLSDGKQIAVKRLSITSGQGLAEFKNEVMLIAKLQHRNLVRLFGCCVERNENLLVYEYMPKRSLDLYIFDSNLATQLDWPKRFNIIKGIARGIMYLHEDSRLRIIHRDLKTSNVLLDDNINPKISDFGMARIFGEDKKEAITRRVVGTYGYMAPEYAMEGLFSVKSDVFSFGVIVLEIISGKKNNGFHHSESGESLLTYAWKLWSKGNGMELVNQLHVQSCVPSEVLKCIHIGLLCVQEDAADRPTMSSVIFMLASDDTITLPRPTEPAFSVGRANGKQSDSYPLSSDGIFSVNEVTITNFLPR